MSTKQRVPSLDGLDTLGVACLLLLLFPLLPLLYEQFFYRHVKEDSLWLAAAMYVIGLGLASKLKTYFVLSLLAGLFATSCYGYVAAHAINVGEQDFTEVWAWRIIVLAAVVHFAERAYRHVFLREQFFEWQR